MSNNSTASSSLTRRNARRSSSSASGGYRQSVQSSISSLSLGVREGGVSQRRTTSTARSSTQSQATATPSLGRKTRRNNPSDTTNALGHVNQPVDVLNTSTTSTATEEMNTSTNARGLNHSTVVVGTTVAKKGTVKKDELIKQFFERLHTGGYLCKLCAGTKDEQKVRTLPGKGNMSHISVFDLGAQGSVAFWR